MPDYICPSCGQKALAVATRCPRCGLAIETQFIQAQAATPKRGRRKLIIIVAVALVVIFGASRLQPPPRPAPVVPLPAAVVVDSAAMHPVAAASDTGHPAPDSGMTTPGTPAAADSVPHPTESSAPSVPPAVTPESAPPVAAVPAPAPALPRGAVRRYAGTWINVRSGRDNHAPVIRILHPGDMVVVDSLVRGWYRVIARGEAVGYLDRRLLDTIPSATRP